MKVCKNLNEVIDYIASIVEREIKIIGERTKDALKMEVKSKFYGRPGYHPNQQETDWYVRTWELLNCIDFEFKKINKNEYQVRIFYNTDKMTTSPSYIRNGKKQWSSHESITTGTDVRLMFPAWLEWGQNSPLYSWEGMNIVGDLYDRWEDDRVVMQHFRDTFRKEGFTVIEG